MRERKRYLYNVVRLDTKVCHCAWTDVRGSAGLFFVRPPVGRIALDGFPGLWCFHERHLLEQNFTPLRFCLAVVRPPTRNIRHIGI